MKMGTGVVWLVGLVEHFANPERAVMLFSWSFCLMVSCKPDPVRTYLRVGGGGAWLHGEMKGLDPAEGLEGQKECTNTMDALPWVGLCSSRHDLRS